MFTQVPLRWHTKCIIRVGTKGTILVTTYLTIQGVANALPSL
ncbi:hypothetical protein Desti_0801 [Desulfomonile tiedjei DSM 6799]|uniref:Uncharacterized protein n=1 Tax=Desulfomonile tiedjei (strain ATCC 49306 / DSM 6799 / DCB-1) TaxID=706587 RepID=I4C1T4_DESTA|nr:hypothetical protein Desti_0801 [Desulfomonile tiedjei DSM 6799]